MARCHVILVLNATARSHKCDLINHKCLHCTLHMQSTKNATPLLYLCKSVLIFLHYGIWVCAADCLWINARMLGKSACTGFYINVYITRQYCHTGSSSQPSSGCSFQTHSPVHTHMSTMAAVRAISAVMCSIRTLCSSQIPPRLRVENDGASHLPQLCLRKG